MELNYPDRLGYPTDALLAGVGRMPNFEVWFARIGLRCAGCVKYEWDCKCTSNSDFEVAIW